MCRFLSIATLIGLLAAVPVSGQVVVAPYPTYYPPDAAYGYSYAPGAVYWNGYYANRGYAYRPYNTYYSYPSGYAWGYPRSYEYYSAYGYGPSHPRYYRW